MKFVIVVGDTPGRFVMRVSIKNKIEQNITRSFLGCGHGYWGPNCSLLCNPNCETCDIIDGYIKCKKQFFGEECSSRCSKLSEFS
jgi:hypothetical protein